MRPLTAERRKTGRRGRVFAGQKGVVRTHTASAPKLNAATRPKAEGMRANFNTLLNKKGDPPALPGRQ